MAESLSDARGLRSSATLVVAGAVLSGPVAAVVVSRVAPQPAWTGVDRLRRQLPPCAGAPLRARVPPSRRIRVVLRVVPRACGCVLRVRASAALVFTGIYASLIFTNYTMQLGFIPRVLKERPAYLAALTMANPSSFAWFLEMFGYAAMGVATWLLADGFRGSHRADAIRWLLIGNGVLSILGAACTGPLRPLGVLDGRPDTRSPPGTC